MIRMLQGDCIESLKTLEDGSINTCITSPPYWGLRNYNDESKQLGMEDTPEEFVENLVNVFKEVKRVLRDDGTLWLNMGDTYKEKQLLGIPWRTALALQEDKWFLRADIIWNKPAVMPNSVKDRVTITHEYIFLLSKNKQYYYDNEIIKEDSTYTNTKGEYRPNGMSGIGKKSQGKDGFGIRSGLSSMEEQPKRNKRSVWTITTKPFKGAHFATFPKDLIGPCVLAGCPEGGTVLDPFGGSGTTGIVAAGHNRNAVLLELNAEYIELAKARIEKDMGMFVELKVEMSDD